MQLSHGSWLIARYTSIRMYCILFNVSAYYDNVLMIIRRYLERHPPLPTQVSLSEWHGSLAYNNYQDLIQTDNTDIKWNILDGFLLNNYTKYIISCALNYFR